MSRLNDKKMTGTKERRTARAPLSLAAARKMLPLVSRIVADIQRSWNRLSALELEQANLDRRRHELAWPERSRRYALTEEIASEQRYLQEAVAELEPLGVVLVDPVEGEATFPTEIHGRPGYFLWQVGASDVTAWCYAHDPTRRPIPPSWQNVPSGGVEDGTA